MPAKKGWGPSKDWNSKACQKALKYGRELAQVNLCACGEPAKHYPEDEPPVCDKCVKVTPYIEMCDCCGLRPVSRSGLNYQRCPDCLVDIDGQVLTTDHGVGPWVDLYFVQMILQPWELRWEAGHGAEFMALEVARAWDGFRGINREIQDLKIRLAESEARNREMWRELAEAFDDMKRLNDIKRMSQDPDYHATLDQLYLVMSIDKGRAVRDIAHGVQGVIFDAKRRNVSGYKGEVGAKLSVSSDKDRLPSDSYVAIITCEVMQKVPAAVCGSRLPLDGDGKVVAPREFFQFLPLGKAVEEQAGA